MSFRRVTVAARVGLHARPATLLSQLAAAQSTPVTIAKVDDGAAGEPVDAASVLALMTLGARHGDVVELRAEGAGADGALDRLVGFLEQDIDEEQATSGAAAS